MCQAGPAAVVEAPAAGLLERAEPSYRWRIVRPLGYFFVCAGVLSVQYSFGSLYVYLLLDLHGSRGTTALIDSLCLGMQCFCAPLTSILCHRIGERRTCLLGAVISASGMALSALATSVGLLFFTYGFIVPLGGSLSLFAGISLATRVYTKTLTRVHGFANMGAMLGPIAVGPLLPKLYYAIGLPNVFLLMACFILVLNGVGGLLLLPVPSKPADSSSSDSSSDSRISMLTVARDRRVLLIGMCCLFGSLGSWVPVVHIVRLAMDRGIDEASASSLLVFLALGNGFFRMPCAYLADKCGRRKTWAACAATYAVLMSLAAPSLPFTSSFAFLGGFAFLSAGLAGGMNTITGTLATECIAKGPRLQAAVSLSFPPLGLGFALGPALAGSVHDHLTGSYTLALFIAAAELAIAASLCLLSVRLHPRPESRLARVVEDKESSSRGAEEVEMRVY